MRLLSLLAVGWWDRKTTRNWMPGNLIMEVWNRRESRGSPSKQEPTQTQESAKTKQQIKTAPRLSHPHYFPLTFCDFYRVFDADWIEIEMRVFWPPCLLLSPIFRWIEVLVIWIHLNINPWDSFQQNCLFFLPCIFSGLHKVASLQQGCPRATQWLLFNFLEIFNKLSKDW